MSSVEAVWTIRFGWLAGRQEDWEKGVLALFSNQMVGGDSVMAYVGNYAVDGDRVSGQLTIMRHDYPESSKADYKDRELRFEIGLEGTHSSDEITGRLVQEGRKDASFIMKRLAPLPVSSAANVTHK
jgi:hypothetical protein